MAKKKGPLPFTPDGWKRFDELPAGAKFICLREDDAPELDPQHNSLHIYMKLHEPEGWTVNHFANKTRLMPACPPIGAVSLQTGAPVHLKEDSRILPIYI